MRVACRKDSEGRGRLSSPYFSQASVNPAFHRLQLMASLLLRNKTLSGFSVTLYLPRGALLTKRSPGALIAHVSTQPFSIMSQMLKGAAISIRVRHGVGPLWVLVGNSKVVIFNCLLPVYQVPHSFTFSNNTVASTEIQESCWAPAAGAAGCFWGNHRDRYGWGCALRRRTSKIESGCLGQGLAASQQGGEWSVHIQIHTHAYTITVQLHVHIEVYLYNYRLGTTYIVYKHISMWVYIYTQKCMYIFVYECDFLVLAGCMP